MSITSGTRLGAYEVGPLLGAGGMGEVYRARDTRLKRDVALKVLPENLAADPDRLARFQREAEVLASLTHPNIARLYEMDEEAGRHFLIMEVVEGDTLAERIARGPLPLPEALDIASQIADALEAAHDRGIVHRDLKPANVKIAPDDVVKVLDFGLAKAMDPLSDASLSHAATLTTPAMTGVGVILGTAAYMSPEQARGKPVDRRSDIWAFGCVLYEMLTGRTCFDAGDSVSDAIAAILRSDPDWNALPADTPQNIRTLLRRCLQKDPRQRLPHVGVARLEIEEGETVGGGSGTSAAHAGRGGRERWRVVLAGIAVVMLGALAIPALLYLRGTPPPDQITFIIDALPSANLPQLSVSPDGRHLAFQGQTPAGQSAVFVRELASTAIRQLPGTEGGGSPFWSPDSRRIGYFANGKLRKIAIDGGGSSEICAGSGFGAWSTQGTILFNDGPSGLFAVSETGGTPHAVEVETGAPAAFPQFLPDGRHFLYSATRDNPGIYVSALDSKTSHLVVPVVSSASYVKPGYILFQDQGHLFAQTFDADSWKVSGERVSLADSIFVNSSNGRAAFSASTNGVLVYRSGSGAAETSQFVWYSRAGSPKVIGKPAAFTSNFDLSRDEKQVAASIVDSSANSANLWLMDLSREGALSPLTHDSAGAGRDVVWSPDGNRLAYAARTNLSGATTENQRSTIERDVRSLDPGHPLISGTETRYVEDWSKDDRYIVFGQPRAGGTGGNGDNNIWVLPLFGTREPFLFIPSTFAVDEPHFSYDTRWIAYGSNEGGKWQIIVVSFPDKKQHKTVSIDGGVQPRWRKDGQELYFLSPDGKMMAVEMATTGTLGSGKPEALFDTGIDSPSAVRDQYAVTANGDRFLVLKPVSQAAPSPITVVVNWMRLLTR